MMLTMSLTQMITETVNLMKFDTDDSAEHNRIHAHKLLIVFLFKYKNRLLTFLLFLLIMLHPP